MDLLQSVALLTHCYDDRSGIRARCGRFGQNRTGTLPKGGSVAMHEPEGPLAPFRPLVAALEGCERVEP